jgi:hypothetical protein
MRIYDAGSASGAVQMLSGDELSKAIYSRLLAHFPKIGGNGGNLANNM